MNLTIPKRNILETVYPNAAVATAQTSGTGGTYAATWAQVVASTTNELVLCGAYTAMAFAESAANFSDDLLLHVQVGVGDSGSEIPVGQFVAGVNVSYTDQNPSVIEFGMANYYPIEPVLIPPLKRLSVRGGASGAHVLVTGTYLVGYEPIDGYPTPRDIDIERYMKGIDLNVASRLTSFTSKTMTYPNAGATTFTSTSVTAGGSSWTVGTWVEFIASAASDVLITGLANGSTLAASRSAIVEIGIGANGFEESVVAVALPGITGRVGPAPGYKKLVRPLYVKKGERVVVRLKASTASISVNIILMGDELL